MADIDATDLTTLTVDLLSAYFASNSVPSEQLSSLIQSTHAALTQINSPAPPEPEVPVHVPAVGIRKSLASRDHIISLIDGKPYKTLKRHLATHGMTPAEYRERYKLPADYPLVAPAYSERRRAVAQKLGLGRSPTKGAQAKAAATNATPATAEAPASPAKPGRKPRAASAAAKPKLKPAAAAKAPGRKPRAAKADGAKANGTAASPAADGAPEMSGKRKLSIAGPKADDAPAKQAGPGRPKKS
ncbi:MucR family transcriptional regulator [Sphingomonas sp. Root710]|uniref:MucR family transcriptional regulator n=1 Tax=Sphingomonas sp. Root710 TaxID=1736594 RepID=UPI0009E8728F|nr:MucR family transcriptional regulator [Sphingomonas sp. Root710]